MTRNVLSVDVSGISDSGAYAMSPWSVGFGPLFFGCGAYYITDTSTHTITITATIFGPNAVSLDAYTLNYPTTTSETEPHTTQVYTDTLSITVTSGGVVVVLQTRSSLDVLYAMAVGVVSPVCNLSLSLSLILVVRHDKKQDD